MGDGGNDPSKHHFSAGAKASLGWITEAETLKVTSPSAGTSTTTGTVFALKPMDTGPNPAVLPANTFLTAKIGIGRGDSYLFLTVRGIPGADGDETTAVFVHHVPIVEPFDTAPHSAVVISGPTSLVRALKDGTESTKTGENAALRTGEALLFSSHLGKNYRPVLVENVLAVAGGGASVKVSFPDATDTATGMPSKGTITCNDKNKVVLSASKVTGSGRRSLRALPQLQQFHHKQVGESIEAPPALKAKLVPIVYTEATPVKHVPNKVSTLADASTNAASSIASKKNSNRRLGATCTEIEIDGTSGVLPSWTAGEKWVMGTGTTGGPHPETKMEGRPWFLAATVNAGSPIIMYYDSRMSSTGSGARWNLGEPGTSPFNGGTFGNFGDIDLAHPADITGIQCYVAPVLLGASETCTEVEIDVTSGVFGKDGMEWTGSEKWVMGTGTAGGPHPETKMEGRPWFLAKTVNAGSPIIM